MFIEDRIHKLAVEAICPRNLEPQTAFEIHMVKLLEEFGMRVLEAVEKSMA